MNSTILKCLQINLRHSKAASLALMHLTEDLKPDCIFIQEPYAVTGEAIHLALVPDGFVSFHKLSHDHAYGTAILIRSDCSDLLCLDEVSCNHTEKATLKLSNFN